MPTYKVKEYSTLHAYFSALLCIPGVFISFYIVPHETVDIIAAFIVIILCVFYLPLYTSIATSEITIDDQGLKQIWIKHHLFTKDKNKEIRWDDFDYYVIESGGGRGRSSHILQIGLKNKKEFIITHLDFHDKKDDFLKFVDDLSEKIKQVNSNRSSELIKYGAPVFNRNYLLVFMTISLGVVIGVPIYFLLTHKSFAPSYWIIIATGLLFAFIGYSAYTHVKKEFKEQ